MIIENINAIAHLNLSDLHNNRLCIIGQYHDCGESTTFSLITGVMMRESCAREAVEAYGSDDKLKKMRGDMWLAELKEAKGTKFYLPNASLIALEMVSLSSNDW